MKNGFNKLKKAIRRNDKVAMYKAIVTMDTRPDKARTYGESALYEINRALRHLRIGQWPDGLTEAVNVVMHQASDAWNSEIKPINLTTGKEVESSHAETSSDRSTDSENQKS